MTVLRAAACERVLKAAPNDGRTYNLVRRLKVPYKYALIVAWSSEDSAFVVDVPELPGCVAHGATPAEAVANAQDAIGLWLDVARGQGRPIPRPKGRRLMSA